MLYIVSVGKPLGRDSSFMPGWLILTLSILNILHLNSSIYRKVLEGAAHDNSECVKAIKYSLPHTRNILADTVIAGLLPHQRFVGSHSFCRGFYVAKILAKL